MEQLINPAEKGPENEIFERVAEHSREFDKHTAENRVFLPEEIQEAWQVKEWKIGDTVIQAIGVSHVPETFLEFRKEIEKAIQESDVVVNEFAPEALGLYDKTSSHRLKSIKSRFNENYDLEDLRQAYLKFERPWNIGVFHHEIELLAAKYGKDMALADLSLSKNPEALLQDCYLYAYGAEQIEENKAKLKRLGLYTGAAALGVAGLNNLIDELRRPMSRRKFLKMGLVAGAAAIAGATPKIIETPPRTAIEKLSKIQSGSEQYLLMMLRDPKLADSLRKLSESGYKKIAFIYGANHLKRVEEYLNNPEKCAEELSAHQELIERNNPDAFRIYRLSPGENNSERFVASKEMIWKRIQ